MKHLQQLNDIIFSDPWMINTLKHIRDLQLPYGYIGAGFIRNRIWDELHRFQRSPLNDIDVLYFDPNDLSIEKEQKLEAELSALDSTNTWSVKNRARMHLWHSHEAIQINRRVHFQMGGDTNSNCCQIKFRR